MKIVFGSPYWGMETLSYEAALLRMKEGGYEAAEIAIHPNKHGWRDIKKLTNALGLSLIAQLPFAAGETVSEYKKSFEYHLLCIAELEPEFVNCHTGFDYYTESENLSILESVSRIEAETGMKVCHEIHRGRFTYSPYQMNAYLNEFPKISFTADFSHWCNVSESMMQHPRQVQIMNRILPHCHYIHARIGFEEGPQINHPADPAWAGHLLIFSGWWKQIYQLQKEKGEKKLFITPEFGPKPYMPMEPFTQKPVASQWEVNQYMRTHLQNFFKEFDPSLLPV